MFQTEKQVKLKMSFLILFAVATLLVSAMPGSADIVLPRIGGDQRMHSVAPMIMPEITFDGTNVVVLDEIGNDWVTLTGSERPVMWPLMGDNEFDPAAVWYDALTDNAYNWQYGWDSAAFNPALLPEGGKIWIEVLSQSTGLSTYDRNNNYAPIFGTDGSSNRWMWIETMAHNAYTVEPEFDDWQATYLVYIGDEITGDPLAGYGSDIVTLTWTSVPEPATLGLMMTGFIQLLRKRRKNQ